MHPIQMVDLREEYFRIKPEVDAAVISVLDNAAYINGPQVQSFAGALSRYHNVNHVVTCANGTDALQIAMMALGLERGDEVITPSFTYIATTEVIALLGLTPVFVDVDEKTFCMDIAALQNAITPKTKAIVPVHLFGHAANMEAVMQIAEAHHLFVIEDNAQAIGCDFFYSDGRVAKTGAIGTVSATSFYPSKNLGCYGDGGAMATNDDALALQLKMIANHGQSKRYYHDIVGCNSRLDTIQAAILEIKLKRLDAYIAARIKVADYYDAAFANNVNIRTPFRAAYCRHVFHQYTLVLDGVDRNGLQEHLAAGGVPSMIYYPVAAHKQKMFSSFHSHSIHLPVTDWLTERVISLPIHTEMATDQLEHITNRVLSYVNK
jgi:dTDP-4-amino-4,6-dideoxygalactose transaminase